MIKTARLTLSIIREEDVQPVFQTMNDEATAAMVSFLNWPITPEQAQWWAQKAAKGFADKSEYLFIAYKDGAPAGCIGVHLEPDQTKAETGYWVTAAHRGQGIASEMLAAVLRFSFEDLGLQSVFATADPANAGSDKILLRSGFQLSEQIEVQTAEGAPRVSNLYVLRQDDYIP